MEWTEDEFFSNGGRTVFSDRLAASLGIHVSTVKVVSVYTGSLVVNYELAASKEEPLDLSAIKEKQTTAFATGAVGSSLGAPVLDVEVVTAPSLEKKEASGGPKKEPESIIKDGQVAATGFAPIVLVQTGSNTLYKFLWSTLDVAAIATPTQIFQAFCKETMQFVLGKNFGSGFISVSMEGSSGADSGEIGASSVDL